MFRSPIAKAIFNHNPKQGWQASSYGTAVETEGRQGISLKEWGPGIQLTIAKMKTLGMDIADEYCDQILPEYAEQADKIIMMSERDYIPVWLNAYTWDYWDVPNPEVCTEAILEEVIELLTKNIEALKKSL